MLVELQHALVQGLTSEMLRHQIGGVLRPQDLSEFEVLLILPLLDPEAVRIYVPQFAGTFALGDGQGCGGARIENAAAVPSEVSEHAPDPQQLGGALNHGI